MNREVKRGRRGFTLVELLTVIGIIVLLVSILMPVVSSVRQKAHATDTSALLANIASGIQRYYADFNAYPGPLHNSQIYNPTTAITMAPPQPGQPATTLDPHVITMPENLVLGLLGGLKPGTTPGTVMYDPSLVGTGPRSLNPLQPKSFPAYMDRVSLSDGDYYEGANNANAPDNPKDSAIPEFLDKFPSGMPILYLRAKVGAPGIASDAVGDQQQQYDLKQIKAYTDSNIGVGRDLPESEYEGSGVSYAQHKHGLRTVNPTASIYKTSQQQQNPGQGTAYAYPYDLYAFLRHPTMPNTPRQKDSFLLISAGIDRVYGTKDDIQYPPAK